MSTEKSCIFNSQDIVDGKKTLIEGLNLIKNCKEKSKNERKKLSNIVENLDRYLLKIRRPPSKISPTITHIGQYHKTPRLNKEGQALVLDSQIKILKELENYDYDLILTEGDYQFKLYNEHPEDFQKNRNKVIKDVRLSFKKYDSASLTKKQKDYLYLLGAGAIYGILNPHKKVFPGFSYTQRDLVNRNVYSDGFLDNNDILKTNEWRESIMVQNALGFVARDKSIKKIGVIMGSSHDFYDQAVNFRLGYNKLMFQSLESRHRKIMTK